MTKTIIASAIALSMTYSHAVAENNITNAMIYGIGNLQCSTINNLSRNNTDQSSQLAMSAYIGGFVSAMNLSTPDKDILNGMSIADASNSVFKYCRTHRSDQGILSIMTVLGSAMKEQPSE